jgi:pimeloyl-ACP methyl ester carboxylesterase
MYSKLMLTLASSGFFGVACNQRGYSPGASPPLEGSYSYSQLGADVWDVAEAVLNSSSTKFHLVGHDHGAMLGWTVAASSLGKRRLLSFTVRGSTSTFAHTPRDLAARALVRSPRRAHSPKRVALS